MNFSEPNCNACLQKGFVLKSRTFCEQCHESLCKKCSDTHLQFGPFKEHNLIYFDQSEEESRFTYEDKITSTPLKPATVPETKFLCHDRVVDESRSNAGKEKGETKEDKGSKKEENDDDLSSLKPKRITEFSVKRPEENKAVLIRGVLGVTDNVIVVDDYNKKLKLYDCSGNYKSSTDFKLSTRGITRVNKDTFATCGDDSKVFLWTVRGQSIISGDQAYEVKPYAHGIHFNYTYFCVLYHRPNAIAILDKQGRHLRTIKKNKASDKKIKFGYDIHMDRETHNIYVPCWIFDGVLCMSVEGKVLWFTPLSDDALWGITEIHGALCVAQYSHGLHMVSKTRQSIRKVLEKTEQNKYAYCIHYDEHKKKLYISDLYKSDIISVYSL